MAVSSLLDWIFRPQCAGCGAPAVTLCEACRASLVELGPACPRCAEPWPAHEAASLEAASLASEASLDTDGPLEAEASLAASAVPRVACRRCAAWPLPLDRVIAPWRFGGQLAAAIRRLKFTGQLHIARDLAPLWAPVLAAAVAEHDAIVVAVPLHWWRRCRRGYDHAWLLAWHACALAGIAAPVAALTRPRRAVAQSTLPAAERAANVRDAFAVHRTRGAQLTGRAVVLVDDVMTTGATLGAAATTLRGAGAGPITALVLARATAARE